MRHVLEIITRSNLGGAQLNLLSQINRMRAHFRFSIASGESGYLTEAARRDGISTYVIQHLVRQISPIDDTLGLLELTHLIRVLKPDLIHCHSSKAGILGRIAARRMGIPVIFTAHGWAFAEGVAAWKRLLFGAIERITAQITGCIITVSEADYRLARRWGMGQDGRLICIPNAIAPTRKMAQPNRPGPMKAIMVARFAAPKDHELLVREAAHVSSPLEIILVGEGPNLPEIRRLASQLPSRHKVLFLGSRDDVEDLLAEAHVFVLMSRWEGMPISILEAMRAGLPVIASAVGGVPEIVLEGKSGYLIPAGEPGLLRRRLEELASDSLLRERMGNAGYSHCMSNHDLDARAQRLVALYGRMIQEATISGRKASSRALPP